MRFDPFGFLKSIERRHGKLSRWLAMAFLGQLSPFNFHLRADLLEWTDEKCVIAVRKRRRVRNHVGSVHAGALFTLGETCAGLVIIRNFPFMRYRPLMSDVKVTYIKQARGDVTGESMVSLDAIDNAKKIFQQGEVPSIEMTTHIYNARKEILAVVTTLWQVKPWGQVKIK